MNTGHQLIIQALKNVQTNTEKIAALIFIGKQLSQQINLNEEEKTTIFQLINDNDNFLIESLKKYSNDNEQEYEFSIYISAYFFEEIVKHSNEKCEFVRIFCKILLSKSNEEETMKPTKIQPKVMETIFDCLDYIVSSSENLSFFDEEFLLDLFFENLILKCYTSGNQWEYRISNIIIKLINNSKCKENAEKFMEKISKFFVNDKSMKKFHLCRLIGFIIRNGPWNNDDDHQIIDTRWIQIIRDEVFILFQNRLNDDLRNLIIEFSSELTMKCKGFDWIKLKRWETTNSKFFRLLLKLITIELEIIWSSHTTNRPGDKIVEHYTRCLMIFEYILFTLIKNVDLDNVPEDDQLQLNPNEIIDSIETIQQTVSQLIQFLFQTFAAINDDDHQKEIKQMIIASLRLLFVYSKEENEIFQAEIDQLKPFIWKFIDQQQQNDQEIEQLRNLIEKYAF
ncbi:uncharacterized protein LOC142646161 [Dermatophagoides pteronyssinus]|uniref:uncharacterized protein LOC142646161 n=1 Tax=Dermatophagoides pteronyssinus TaxID=6956 RepID=UPI003F670F76